MSIDGNDAFIYYGNAGAEANTVLAAIKDATISHGMVEADVSRRGVDFRLAKTVMHDISVTFTVIASRDDAGLIALVTAARNRTAISLLILDGPKNAGGSRGIDADWTVTARDEPQPIDNIIEQTFTVKPTMPAVGGRAPVWVTTANPV